jgi:hypothetical protein
MKERTIYRSRRFIKPTYDRVRGRQLGSAVFISDLAAELQIGLPKLPEWIHREVIESGHGNGIASSRVAVPPTPIDKSHAGSMKLCWIGWKRG